MNEPHVCDYTADSWRLPGVHGGVPDPDPADARADGFKVGVTTMQDMELSCAHWGRGCWWTLDLTGNETLGELLTAAGEHLATAHVRTVDGTVEQSVVPGP